jgi:hypothetical protein
MRIVELYDLDKDIKINDMKEVTSSIIYQPANHFNPNGLFSEEIFGQTSDERTYRCAYIKLPIHVFNPGVAKTIIGRSGGIIKKMAYAEVKCNLVNGVLVPDADGLYTGLRDLYEIWDKIDIKKTLKTNNTDALNILIKSPKRLIWNDKVLVIPPNLRPISDMNGKTVKSELNSIYIKLLGLRSVTQFTTTNVYRVYNQIQDAVISIYTFMNDFVSTKEGFFQKNLLAKNTMGTVRNVISAPTYSSAHPEVGIYKTGYPMHSLCSMFKPFVKFHMKQFLSYDNLQAIHTNPDEVNRNDVLNMYDDREIENLIQVFMSNPGSRFRILYLDPEGTKPIMFNGLDLKKQEPIVRPFTLTDLIFISIHAAVIVPERMAYLVRYPIGKYLGAFFTGIYTLSTNRTMEVQYNGVVYKTYPIVDPNASHTRVSTMFVDVVNMANARLQNIGGDYDGDTVKSTGIWSDEANEKARKLMRSKIYNVYSDGSSVFPCSLECLTGLYGLTK